MRRIALAIAFVAGMIVPAFARPSAAREIGTFSFMTKGANPKEVIGKFVVVWEKIGSDWKLAADIWNEGK